MATLASSFLRGHEGTPPGAGADALETALAEFCAAGNTAWPDVPLDATVLAAYAGERVADDQDPLASLRALRAADLYLACACGRGCPEALRAFQQAFVSKLPLYLRSLRPEPELVAETRQQLMERLFVAEAGTRPKIAQYSGRGALEGWVRVAALRIALSMLEAESSERRVRDSEDALVRGVVPEATPELELMEQSLRAPFAVAFREALGLLPERDRAVLRFTYVEQLQPARIAAIYGVHRTTVLRWREAAEAAVLARTRELLMARLRLTPSDCDGLFQAVRSRLHLTLRSLLRTPS
jgi:RNA polymerase sigma-70 factor (ECF subfamily)